MYFLIKLNNARDSKILEVYYLRLLQDSQDCDPHYGTCSTGYYGLWKIGGDYWCQPNDADKALTSTNYCKMKCE